MHIHFNGAAQSVTGSQHLLEINGYRILLECGLFQGRRKDTYKKNLSFPFDPQSLDAVLLSHAHIDHSGNLPNLVKQGFRGPIYATTGTVKLAEVMIQDSAHIQESDVAYINKRRLRQGKLPIQPLYTAANAEKACEQFRAIPYEKPFEPVPGVQVTFREAGHILGSAAIVLDITENGRSFRLWFSGDIGRYHLPLLKDPVLPEKADYLIMECTYGDKIHADPRDAYEEFKAVVQRTIKRGGKVIIPAFSVGRTQELVYDLNRMIAEGDIPRIPVFVDSPLAVRATDIFRNFEDYFDEETQIFEDQNGHLALCFKGLTYIRSVEESKALNKRKDPMVIISASGMAETGRILHHLRNNIENPRNTILIVSWQAPYTLGRRLAEQQTEVKIFGEIFERRAELATIGGLSAHGDQNMLLQYAEASKDTLKHIFLVHGEDKGALPLMDKIRAKNIAPVSYPKPHKIVEI
jgi:metallo-beta-lactamase family protein